MKYFNILMAISVCILLLSCARNRPEDDTGSEESMGKVIPFLMDTLVLDNNEYCFIEKPLFFKEKIVLFIKNDNTFRGWIECRDKNTLELLWTWQEAYAEFGTGAYGFGPDSYIHQGILVTVQNNLSYGIDINSGTTLWKNRGDKVLSIVKGVDNFIASSTYNNFNFDAQLIIGDVHTGEWREVYNFIKDDTLRVSMVLPTPFSWNNKQYVAFVTIKWTPSAQTRINKLNLYNITEDKLEWTSDTIPLYHPLSGTPGGRPQFEDGQILLANDAIYSYNVEDGTLEWWNWYGNSFVVSSQPKAADGKVFANNGDQYFIGLDVHTGEEIFRTVSGGSPSKIAHHDGKCYMAEVTSGGRTWLMVIDCVTGAVLHKEEAPFIDEDRLWSYDRIISVDPETGLVYTADHKYLLVYDFEE